MQDKQRNLSGRKIAQLIILLVFVIDIGILFRSGAGLNRPWPKVPGNQAVAAVSIITEASAASSATSVATAPATTTAAPAYTAIQATVPAVSETDASPAAIPVFPGIDPAVAGQWIFPMKIEPSTPSVGVFGAGRTSKRLHAGIDLYSPEGTEIYAMTDGHVQNILIFYENLKAIEVVNNDGTTIRYCELTPLVKVGDKIVRGQLIGKLKKNSGGTCMLHLELYATAGSAALTQTKNKHYLYVSTQYGTFMRRQDLVDPSDVYGLPRLRP